MKFTIDTIVRRLRWIMVGAIIFDKLNTLLGQPGAYWNHPEAANEGNAFFRLFLSRGLPAYLLFSLVYIAVIFVLVSIIPRRLALVSIFAFILGHYFGASTWLSYRWHFGITAPIIYGIILGVLIVLLAFPTPDRTNTKNLASADPAT
ncbi:MAG TPA: hypothetical protein VK742_10445 [Candidatus Sulfotelmatobacter sp.]|jgi:hypothetical protein|nr:hypothetical protein [Candidatus Sulfotelmatobacter sp.]